jgi:hypothetical protein
LRRNVGSCDQFVMSAAAAAAQGVGSEKIHVSANAGGADCG